MNCFLFISPFFFFFFFLPKPFCLRLLQVSVERRLGKAKSKASVPFSFEMAKAVWYLFVDMQHVLICS